MGAFTCLSNKIKKNYIQNIWKKGGDDIINSFAYSYQLFNKCFVKNCETCQFHIFLIFNLICFKISLFCLNFLILSIELI